MQSSTHCAAQLYQQRQNSQSLNALICSDGVSHPSFPAGKNHSPTHDYQDNPRRWRQFLIVFSRDSDAGISYLDSMMMVAGKRNYKRENSQYQDNDSNHCERLHSCRLRTYSHRHKWGASAPGLTKTRRTPKRLLEIRETSPRIPSRTPPGSLARSLTAPSRSMASDLPSTRCPQYRGGSTAYLPRIPSGTLLL